MKSSTSTAGSTTEPPETVNKIEVDSSAIIQRIELAIEARAELFDKEHRTAFRLFHGYYEGIPGLAIDLYGRTLVVHNFANPASQLEPGVLSALNMLHEQLGWVRAAVLKTRHAPNETERRGKIIWGESTDERILENGVWFAIDLLLNQDSSLYLDTRNVRIWAKDNLNGRSVLNTFAYTGSFGVAASAGGARQVTYIDLSERFLKVAQKSCSLNAIPLDNQEFLCGDFFPLVKRLKGEGKLFDCIFLDPPFFAKSKRGSVDLVQNSHRVINKVRPLINDGGYLIAINNALFVSGLEFMKTLEGLCEDGYLKLEKTIPVPVDFTGFPRTIVGKPPADPTPFNHPTKIAVLRVRRKLSK